MKLITEDEKYIHLCYVYTNAILILYAIYTNAWKLTLNSILNNS